MKIKIISGVVLMVVASLSHAQNNVNNNFETSASIESFCKIETNDINFGVVASPLTAQNANAQMNVLCSNAKPYKVDLEYGGNYVGQSNPINSGVTVSMSYESKLSYETRTSSKQSGYRLYKDGQPISSGVANSNISGTDFSYNLNNDGNLGDFACVVNTQTYIYFRTLQAAQLVQGTSVINQYVKDINGICDTTTGRLNQSNFNKLFTGTKADKGVMTGTFKGDKLAYQVTLPGDSSKPWIAGVNSYSSIGIGSNQTIEVNARIVPEASSSSYIAADTYLDTVIAVVTY